MKGMIVTNSMDLLGLGLLLISIIYTGRQVNLYMRLRSRLGKLVYVLTPSKFQKKMIISFGSLFLLLFAIVTYNYISQGISLNFTYAIVLALVVYSSGRFITRIVELRENGLLGQLNAIEYGAIRNYTIETRGKSTVLLLRLQDNREFAALISKVEIEDIKSALKTKM